MYWKLALLFSFTLLFSACPKGAEKENLSNLPNGDSLTKKAVSVATPAWGWNPKEIFPDIDLIDIYPDPLPELENGIPADATVVNAGNIGDGSIFNDPDKWFFVVEPGDYSDLERIKLTASGTADQRRVIMARGEAPWNRDPENRSRFDAFDIRGDYWMMYNLEFFGHSAVKDDIRAGVPTRLMNVGHCTFSHCLWRNARMGLRIYGNRNTVQFCVFKDKPLVSADVGGVVIMANTGKESRGNRVLGCEFAGMSDGVGVPWSDRSDSGSTPETIIAFNNSWIPKSLYRKLKMGDEYWTTSCAEDGYDVKNGAITNDPSDRCFFIGNISRGHRVTDQDCGGSGSTGAAWLFHRRARNWLIAGNLSYDDAMGCYVKGYSLKGRSKDQVEAMEITQNVFAYLASEFPGGGEWKRGRENPDDGLALRVSCPTCEVHENIIVGADKDSYDPKVIEANIHDNLFVDVINKRLKEGHKSRTAVTWKKVRFKASPLLNPEEVIEIEVPLKE
ncbi:MAG: hypothetical protein GYB31_15460 [Bacteroidetes bacterium]|nr:hypothetical protein [Bacteroidota bacterium]